MKRLLQNELDDDFLVFWEAYPRKRDKVTARRAWRRLNGQKHLIEILQGINRYMASGEWRDPQFIPYPATFLNGRRWEDEISVKRNPCDDQPDAGHSLFKKGYVPRQARTHSGA